MRADGRKNMGKLTVAFRNFVKATKTGKIVLAYEM
jgi:hypothetical protein